MDHLYNSIFPFYEPTLDEFMAYHNTGKYKTLSSNPMYKEISMIIKCLNTVADYLGYERTKLADDVKNYND